jgi:hypothetical protein
MSALIKETARTLIGPTHYFAIYNSAITSRFHQDAGCKSHFAMETQNRLENALLNKEIETGCRRAVEKKRRLNILRFKR